MLTLGEGKGGSQEVSHFLLLPGHIGELSAGQVIKTRVGSPRAVVKGLMTS